jgi:hypothetical protein
MQITKEWMLYDSGGIMVGILTLSASDNCGSLLQAYALQQCLKRKYRVESEIIDFRPERSSVLYSIFPKKPLQEKRKMMNAICNYKLIRSQKEDYESFRKNWLNMTKNTYKSIDNLKNLQSYACVITGSDQVWNVKMPDFDMAYFLEWFYGKKVAYAPSAGGVPIQDATNTTEIAEILKHFNALSARENCCKDSVEELTGRKTELVLDPTLLLTQQEWQSSIEERVVPEAYIFYYSWAYNSDTINRKVAEFAKKNNLPVYVINQFKWTKHRPSEYGFTMCKNAGPQTFLSLMKYARYAMVQSFHGVIFAYQMDKEFFFLDDQPEEQMDVRLKQILSLLGKMNQVLRPEDNIAEKIDILKTGNKETRILKELREASYQYIEKMVEEL